MNCTVDASIFAAAARTAEAMTPTQWMERQAGGA